MGAEELVADLARVQVIDVREVETLIEVARMQLAPGGSFGVEQPSPGVRRLSASEPRFHAYPHPSAPGQVARRTSRWCGYRTADVRRQIGQS